MKVELLDISDPDLIYRIVEGEEVLFMFKKEDLPNAEPEVKVNRLGIPKEYEPHICTAVEDAHWASIPMSRPMLLSMINDGMPKGLTPLKVL